MLLDALPQFLVVAVTTSFSVGCPPLAGDGFLEQNATAAAVLLLRCHRRQDATIFN
jgi:hypothetical protein